MQNGCETLWVSAIRWSGYVWSGKLKRPPLPSGVRRWIRNIRMEWWQRRFRIWDIRVECWQSRIPDVRHPGGMSAVQNSGCENKIEDDKKPSSGVSGHLLPRIPKNSPQSLGCFGGQKVIKTPKLNTIWLELIARVLNMLIGLKGDNYYSKVFKRVNYKLWNNTFWVVITYIYNLIDNKW